MRSHVLAPLLCLPLLAACGEDPGASAVKRVKPPSTLRNAPPVERRDHGEPERVTVEHILIGVKPGMKTARYDDPAEAKAVAYRILDELEAGADFQALKEKHSEDRPARGPARGPYALANVGVRPRAGESGRGGMVKGFGDVAFSLDVGEVGIADYDPVTSPFGYHVVKRVR